MFLATDYNIASISLNIQRSIQYRDIEISALIGFIDIRGMYVGS